MSGLRLGFPIWLERNSRARRPYASLTGHHSADIAVVGGGVTGCACARLIAQAGARVVLLEAGAIGLGSTAASTALLMHEPDVDFTDLARRYGTSAAARIWRAGQKAKEQFIEALAALDPPSRLARMPSIYFSRDGRAERGLTRELEARHHAGLGGRWLSADALRAKTGIDGAGAIETAGNAAFDPYRACVALARAACDEGARIFERSRVRRVEADRHGVTLTLARGSVYADQVVVATGYATPEFKPLTGRFRMLSTYVIATPVLARRVRREMGLGDVMLWDTERPYHYARWTPDGRLIFGGRDRPRPPLSRRKKLIARTSGDLLDDLQSWYPALRGVRAEYAWEGLFAVTPDGLPYVGAHHRYPRHLFALGYGGNGMAFAFLAAQIIARAAAGRPAAADALFTFARMRR